MTEEEFKRVFLRGGSLVDLSGPRKVLDDAMKQLDWDGYVETVGGARPELAVTGEAIASAKALLDGATAGTPSELVGHIKRHIALFRVGDRLAVEHVSQVKDAIRERTDAASNALEAINAEMGKLAACLEAVLALPRNPTSKESLAQDRATIAAQEQRANTSLATLTEQCGLLEARLPGGDLRGTLWDKARKDLSAVLQGRKAAGDRAHVQFLQQVVKVRGRCVEDLPLFRGDCLAKLTDVGSIEPTSIDVQSPVAQAKSKAFAKLHSLDAFSDLPASKDEVKERTFEIDGIVYNCTVAMAPFKGKGSGAEFFTIKLSNADSQLETTAVVKKLKPDLWPSEGPDDTTMNKHNDEASQQLAAEVATLEQMSAHPFGVEFYGASRVGKDYFVAMEMVSGGDISERVEGDPPASEAEVMHWLLTSGEAIASLHGAGKCHGDIKGDAVLIDESGDALLADYGEARDIDDKKKTADMQRFIQMIYKMNLATAGEKTFPDHSEILTNLRAKADRTVLDQLCLETLEDLSGPSHSTMRGFLTALSGMQPPVDEADRIVETTAPQGRDPTGDELATFTMKEDDLVAQGADGKVYIAKHENPEIGEVIVKVPKESAFDEVKKEARILDLLGKNENIIGVFGFIEEEHHLFLEKADTGLNKAEALHKSVKDKARLISGIADGLTHMHSKGIAHKDLNLKNVLAKDGDAKLCDFGAALVFEGGDSVLVPVDPGIVEAFGVDSLADNIPNLVLPLTNPPSVRVSLADAFKDDTRSFGKMAYNVLVEEAENNVLPGTFAENLQAAINTSEVNNAAVAALIRIFADVRSDSTTEATINAIKTEVRKLRDDT